jgi:hypothetical protein
VLVMLFVCVSVNIELFLVESPGYIICTTVK